MPQASRNDGDTMKPYASLSLDLDNQWSYMKTHGDEGWEDFPSYFDVLIPHALEVLERLELKITFFIVGQDVALEKNADALSLLTKHGHEVGNHSFHHEPWLHLRTKEQVEQEIIETEEHIVRVTGQKPRGFRGPGFSWSVDLLEILAARNYVFDASTLPMYIGPLARMYYFWTADLTKEEKQERKQLFGTFKEGLRPVNAYQWQLLSGRTILEIPVTTMPILKVPFHLSYLLYLSRFSQGLMTLYLKTALTLCRLTRTEPSFLLHPLDLLGGDQIPELAFFPGMDLNAAQKVQVFEKVLRELGKYFTLVPMSVHAKAILQRQTLRMRSAESQ
jgi:hypothetical protein